MVTYVEDGILGGMIRRENDAGYAAGTLAVAGDREGAAFFASAGTVDTNTITRILYDVTISNSNYNEQKYVRALTRMTFTSGDVSAAGSGKVLTMSAFVAPASDFAAGSVPSPLTIRNAPNTKVYRSLTTTNAAGTFNMSMRGPNPDDLTPNTKYWIMIVPTAVTAASTPSVANDVPIGTTNTLGRALSFWTSRTPLAPTITSPESQVAKAPGESFEYAFTPNHPDAFPPLLLTPIRGSFRICRVFKFSTGPSRLRPTPTRSGKT